MSALLPRPRPRPRPGNADMMQKVQGLEADWKLRVTYSVEAPTILDGDKSHLRG